MRIGVKVIIVMLILLLSLGPLSWFFNVTTTSPQTLPPPNPNDTGPVVRTYAANLTGKIMDVKPYISYVGFSTSNNEGYVRGVLNGIGFKNYTVSTTLNPQGPGYVYSIRVFFDNVSMAKEIGFRVYYKLYPFFYQQSVPLLTATILLPDTVDTENIRIYVPQNTNASAILLYRETPGFYVGVECSELITSLNYNLTNVNGPCIDETETIPNSRGNDYGLTISDVGENSEQFAENQKVSVDVINSINFNVTYPISLPESNITAKLTPINANLIPIISLGRRDGIVWSNDTSTEEASKIRDTLASLNVTITGDYKIGEITMPAQKVIGGQTYDLFAFPKTYVNLKFSDGVGEINARFTYTTIFKEVYDIQAEKLS